MSKQKGRKPFGAAAVYGNFRAVELLGLVRRHARFPGPLPPIREAERKDERE